MLCSNDAVLSSHSLSTPSLSGPSLSPPQSSPASIAEFSSAFRSPVYRWSHGVEWRSPVIIRAQTRSTSPVIEQFERKIAIRNHREKELEALIRIKDDKGSMEGVDDGSMLRLSRFLEENRVDLVSQDSFLLRTANDIMSKLGAQLEPFRVVTNETSPWEEKSAAVRLANKMQKSRRSKQWRKRKRRIAEMLVKEREQFDQADQEADEWRAREIAKDIAKRKVSKSSTCDSFEAPQDKASIVENDATLEDMEGAAVAYVADILKVPAIFIKALTNVVDGDKLSIVEYWQNLAAVTAALGLAVTEVVDLINGKCLSKL